MTDNGQAIIELDKKRMQAMAAKDFATLETVRQHEVRRHRLQVGRTVRG